jgi:hypothetical protein
MNNEGRDSIVDLLLIVRKILRDWLLLWSFVPFMHFVNCSLWHACCFAVWFKKIFQIVMVF